LRRTTATTVALLACLARTAWATEGLPAGKELGIGLIVGHPTGLSAKVGLGGRLAIDAALGWRFGDSAGLRLHGDLLVHQTLTRGSGMALALYVGIGPSVGAHRDQVGLAVRLPVGLALTFGSTPIDTFLELVPSLGILPGSSFFLNAAIGVRLWF
jgi:hypothetical protein